MIISGHSVIHQFTRIGRLSMMAGCSGISKDCPPFCMVPPYGVSTVSGLNVIGLRRAGIGPEQRAAIKKAFGIVYRSGLNVTQALERLKAEPFEGPVREFIEFIEKSKRGICRFGRGGEEEERE